MRRKSCVYTALHFVRMRFISNRLRSINVQMVQNSRDCLVVFFRHSLVSSLKMYFARRPQEVVKRSLLVPRIDVKLYSIRKRFALL